MEFKEKTHTEILNRKIHVLRHTLGELQHKIPRLKLEAENELKRKLASAQGRKNHAVISESMTLNTPDGDFDATLRYVSGEKSSADTREDKKDLSMMII